MSVITFSKPATIKEAIAAAREDAANSLFRHIRQAVKVKFADKVTEIQALNSVQELETLFSQAREPVWPPQLIDTKRESDDVGGEAQDFEDFFNVAEAFAHSVEAVGAGKFHIHFEEVLNHEKKSKVEWRMIFQVNGRIVISYSILSNCYFSGSSSCGSQISQMQLAFHKTWVPT